MDSDNDRQLESMESGLSSLTSYRAGLMRELEALQHKRRDLQIEVKKISGKIREERISLRGYYEQFKQLDHRRQEVLTNLGAVRKRIGEIQKLIRRHESGLPRAAGERYLKDLREAEWNLQTARLTREQEKSLVKHIRELESMLIVWKKAGDGRQELRKLLEEQKSLKSSLQDLDKLDEGLTPEFRISREKVSNIVKARDQLFHELDDLGIEIIDLESKVSESSKQLTELRRLRMKIIDEMRMKETQLRMHKRAELLREAQRTAREKLSRGRKLSLDELRLAFGEDEAESLK